MAFVADNSVVAAWFIESQSDGYSLRLLDRAAKERVHVPLIWRAEFASVLLTFAHNRRLQPAHVAAIIDHIERLGLIHDAAPPPVRALVALGQRYALGAYDACYLELALRLNLPLAVRDASLRDAAVRAGAKLA